MDVALASISGGTGIISCFVLGCPWRPVYESELQWSGLGMAVDVFDVARLNRSSAAQVEVLKLGTRLWRVATRVPPDRPVGPGG